MAASFRADHGGVAPTFTIDTSSEDNSEMSWTSGVCSVGREIDVTDERSSGGDQENKRKMSCSLKQ